MHRGLQKLPIVIPCYNQGRRRAAHHRPTARVCRRDRSRRRLSCTDRTAEVARSLGARVVAEEAQGYGAAYQAGLPAATGGASLVTLDGDGTYPADQIPELVDFLVDKQLDFVNASRFPLGNPKAMNFSTKLATRHLDPGNGGLVRQTGEGFAVGDGWVYRTPVYRKLRVTSDGMWLFRKKSRFEATSSPGSSLRRYSGRLPAARGRGQTRQMARRIQRTSTSLVKKRFS